jgi:hypothetical protein
MVMHPTNVIMKKKQESLATRQLAKGGDAYANRCDKFHSLFRLSGFGL